MAYDSLALVLSFLCLPYQSESVHRRVARQKRDGLKRAALERSAGKVNEVDAGIFEFDTEVLAILVV